MTTQSLPLAITALTKDIERLYGTLPQPVENPPLTSAETLAKGFIGHGQNVTPRPEYDQINDRFWEYVQSQNDPLACHYDSRNSFTFDKNIKLGLSRFFKGDDEPSKRYFNSYLQNPTSTMLSPSAPSSSNTTYFKDPQAKAFLIITLGSMPLWYFASNNWGLLGAGDVTKNLLLMNLGACLVAMGFVLVTSAWNYASGKPVTSTKTTGDCGLTRFFGLNNSAWFFNHNAKTGAATSVFMVSAAAFMQFAWLTGYWNPTVIGAGDAIGLCAAFLATWFMRSTEQVAPSSQSGQLQQTN